MTAPGVGSVWVVDDVAAAFAALVVDQAPTSIALSGGSTARRCYQALAGAGLDWSAVSVYFGDERWVPVASEDSNEGMARAALLDVVAPDEVHSLRGAGATPDEAAAAYHDLLAGMPALDLVHLGLGDDGHTASLFPGSPALDVEDALVVATGDGVHPHPRLSFTFPAIARARLAVVTVSGAAKAPAWQRVCAGDDIPAARVRADRVLWLVDPEAAGN